MINVGITDLRDNLKYYLDLLEQGEELKLIRRSTVIGIITPTSPKYPQKLGKTGDSSDNIKVQFRRFGAHESPDKLKSLNRVVVEATGILNDPEPNTDLESPVMHYDNLGGEFWVGILDKEIVAMGAFRLKMDGNGAGSAELKRMRVRPDLQGKGIGSQLLQLLESRAVEHGYHDLVLDTVRGEQARQFYEHHGFQETGRRQAGELEQVFYKKEL
jgi:GNAT superfamily N-acetyltransferase